MQKNCYNYPIEFVDDVFGESSELADAIKKHSKSSEPRILLVADMNVVHRTEGLGSKIGKYLQAHGISLAASPVVIAGGEKIKVDNLQSALKIVSAILEAKLGVDDCVVALGGGSLLDVAGYAASQVRGGIGIVRIPTTVAAMIEGGFASYAAVDSVNVKDALRVPSTPISVLVDTSFASTILDGVWRGGIGEAVRLALSYDASFFKKIVKNAKAFWNRDAEVMAELVKGAVTTRRKKGASLLGEWCAARLESMSGYKLPHGYAVSIGICVEAEYALLKGWLKESERDAIRALLGELGAIDGLEHSRHLFSQPDNVLFGLDAWRLSTGSQGVMVPCGIGKLKSEPEPDREIYNQVLCRFCEEAN
jgi:3-dehydroquinate synthase